MRQSLLFLSLQLMVLSLLGQETYPNNGAPDIDHNLYVLDGASIHIDPNNVLDNGQLWVQDGRILKVTAGEVIPSRAIVKDCEGQHIYPSFIDLYSDYGMPEVKKGRRDGPQIERPDKSTGGWNAAIKPEEEASAVFKVDAKAAKSLREQGFGSVLVHPTDGIIRGTGAVVGLGEQNESQSVIKARAAQIFSFDKGSSSMDYPSSRMGAIALIRQTMYDQAWYSHPSTETDYDRSLEALGQNLALPQLFITKEKNDIPRADKIGEEFGLQFIFIGTGNEYERVLDMKAAGGLIVIPLNYPEAYDMSDPFTSDYVDLHDLRHWEQAPSNAAYLKGMDIDIAFTSNGLKDVKQVLPAIRKAVQHGLSPRDALDALTTTPAQALGLEQELGAIRAGMRADFFLADDDVLGAEGNLLSHWLDGKEYKQIEANQTALHGRYDLNLNGIRYTLKIGQSSTLITKQDTVELTVKATDRDVVLNFNLPGKGLHRLHGSINPRMGIWTGSGVDGKGQTISWNVIRKKGELDSEDKNEEAEPLDKLSRLSYPNTGFGWTEAPEAEHIVIRNATVWTNESAGVMQDADVVISDGKILAVGHNLVVSDLFRKAKDMPEFKVIDAYGKHVTSGIIDEHSHIAITGGVNESGQASSAEVSIGDVVDPEDIDIYYALSGGVTACQLLHGSANPIGGQSALIKLHWGQNADQMLIDDAPKFIKFALGENVKQSNWGPKFRQRFPQTRMGVEQVFYDHFHRAEAYQQAQKRVEENSGGRGRRAHVSPMIRRDLELEALAEILHSERYISCHSYVQSEVNMLMHVADSMGFRLNTFTHILEGYKVAHKMAEHRAGASTFSDWWAYKYEVREATPYNASILHDMGVVVAINSDDAEMGRRLNQEAAKTVKYGGMSEEDAWKTVTLNPAKLLHLDDRMGSLAVGKDADIVIWSDNPLSIYSKAERTYVDGICYFDIEQNKAQEERIAKERALLIEKMQKSKGGKKKPKGKHKHRYHCDHIGE